MTDRITVIRDGTYVGTVNTKETDTDELVAMMVGRSLQNYYTRDYDTLKEDSAVLEVENLTKREFLITSALKSGKGDSRLCWTGRRRPQRDYDLRVRRRQV